MLVTLKVDKASYRLNEEIAISVQLENTSPASISIYGRLLWGFRGGIVLHIANAKGDPVHPSFLDDDAIVPQTLMDRDTFVMLAPNHFLGVKRTDRVSDLFHSPGNYTLSVDYLSPVPEEFKITNNLWTREKGVVRSASVTIEVTAADARPTTGRR